MFFKKKLGVSEAASASVQTTSASVQTTSASVQTASASVQTELFFMVIDWTPPPDFDLKSKGILVNETSFLML